MRAEQVRAWKKTMTAVIWTLLTPQTAMTWMIGTSLAKMTVLTAISSFKTSVQWIL